MTDDGGALAWGVTLTVSPLTIVTVRGAPLPEYRPIVGYPSTVQGVAPVFVTVTTPVIVPAAPWDCPAAAVMWLHAAEPAAVELVVEALLVEVVEDELVVAWCVVVVE